MHWHRTTGFRRTTTVLLLLGIAAAILSMLPGERTAPPPLATELHAHPPEDLAALSESIGAWQSAAPEQRAAYLDWLLRRGLEERRTALSRWVDARANHRAQIAAGHVTSLFFLLALASFAIVLLPFFVSRERAPRRRRLWSHSVLAAGILAFTFSLLGLALNVLMLATSSTSRVANPEQGLVDASIDRLEQDARALVAREEGVESDPLPYGPALGTGAAGQEGGFLANILHNLEYFDPQVFKPAIVWSHRAWNLLGALPHVVPFLVGLVFLLTMRDLLGSLLVMPVRAARGEKRSGRRALAGALAFIGREMLSILALVIVLGLLSVLINVGVRHLSRSLVTLTLEETRTTVEYFGRLTIPPDQSRLTFGMLAVPAYLGLATLLTITGFGFFAFWARRLIQARFHRKHSLRNHGRFWRRGLMALLRIQWIPVLTLWLVLPWLTALHKAPLGGADEALDRLVQSGWILGLALLVTFPLFGGLRALSLFLSFRPHGEEEAERGYELRRATEADHDFLREAHHKGLRPAVERTFGWDDELQEGFVQTWFASLDAELILVRGVQAGYLEVRQASEQIHLTNLVLLPSFQGRGLGTRILGDLIERAERRGLPITLQVMVGNPAARRLYERLGFVVTGSDPNHVQMRRPPTSPSPRP